MSNIKTLTSAGTPLHGPASPWARYWARHVDIAIYSIIALIALRFVYPHILKNSLFHGPASQFIIPVILLPCSLIIEVFILSSIKETSGSIGKSIAGIKMVDQSEGSPVEVDLITRNFILYFRGMGMGLPLVFLVTYLEGMSKLRNGQLTPWDIYTKTKVINIDGSIYRTTYAFIIFCILTASISAAYEDNWFF